MKDILNKVLSRNPKKILNKAENYALYETGFFGNKALTWNSYNEIIKSGWTGKVCMRSKKGIEREKTLYNIALEEIQKHIEAWINTGISEDQISFNQSMPDENLLIQGEVMRKLEQNLQVPTNELYLLFSTVKKPMNLALSEESFEISGEDVKFLLRQNLFPESFDDLEKLLAEFPESVVEFSAYSVPVGNMAHLNRNTIFWEVRNY